MSDAERWKRVKEIFDAAVDRDGAERAAMIVELCGDDHALRAEVESLLAADRDRKSLFERPVVSADAIMAIAGRAPAERDPSTPTLAPGTQLGAYSITGLLGTGGMGAVYRATDPKLGREVAIKILPGDSTAESDHLTRFEREARVLAALNHPNVGAIYGTVEENGTRGLVLELIDGETLADRLAARTGPSRGLRPTDALNIALQIAEALEAAHERGIVHRDLKPDNVLVGADGRVKVLDFGVATLVDDGETARSHRSASGLGEAAIPRSALFGTAPYMSPEQIRGEAVDRRTDIWAFGCVLYELLTGVRAFDGADATETLWRVTHQEPDYSQLPKDTPAVIRRLLQLGLEKDRAKRLPHVAIARFQIAEILGQPSVHPGEMPAGTRPRAFVYALASGLALGVLFTLALAWLKTDAPSSSGSPPVRLLVGLSPADQLGGAGGRPTRTAFAISPDGRTLVFSALRGNERALYLRRLEDADAVPFPGSTNGENPFFSPDGLWVAYWVNGRLVRSPLSGGPPVPVTHGNPLPFVLGSSWGSDGRIVFSAGAELLEVPADGGTPTPLTVLDASRHELSHRLPHVLPGGETVLFTITRHRFPKWDETELAVYSRRTQSHKVLTTGGADARYSASGHLVYMREGVLFAAPFDEQRLEITGGPVGVVADVMQAAYHRRQRDDSGAGQFGLSTTGTLVYLPGGTAPREQRFVRRVARSGQSERLPIAPHPFATLRLSPDGEQIALSTFGWDRAVWFYSTKRGTLSRLSSAGRNGVPVWMPDGVRITYAGGTTGRDRLHAIRADGAGTPEALVASDADLVPATWTPDGRQLLFYPIPPVAIRVHDTETRERSLPPVVEGDKGGVGGADLSLDGRWLAYHSNESGSLQVYVQAYPAGVPRFRISPNGGMSPVWRRDGRELFYIRPSASTVDGASPEVSMMSVSVTNAPVLSFGLPRELFRGRYAVNQPARAYDITPDGREFLVLEAPARVPERLTHLNIIQNWTQELERVARPAR